MKAKLLSSLENRTYALVFETGEEVIQTLGDFARENDLTGSHFSAIGAFSDLVVAYYDWQRKDYHYIPIREQVEVLVLTGDIAVKDHDPTVHAHVVVGKSDGSAYGGHLSEAHVRPTLELILTESPAHLRKQADPETGLALLTV